MNKKIKREDLTNTLFFQVPQWLMELFLDKKISQGGFKTYVLMYDRLKLSAYNNWIDKEGDVYIKFSYDELQEKLKCSRQAVSDNLNNLVKLDLIDKVKGFNTSNKFYLKAYSSLENLTSKENLTNSSLENLTNSSLENLDTNKNYFNKNKTNKNNIYSDVFNHYLSKDNLIKHKTLTLPMKKAIDTAIKNYKLDIDCLKRIIDRHSEKIELNKEKTEFKLKARSLSELFGQKKYQSQDLICADYLDEAYEIQKVVEIKTKNKNSIALKTKEQKELEDLLNEKM